jgi:hypothetical protein
LHAVEAVPAVQRKRNPLQPEPDARCVRHRGVGGLDAEHFAEMVLMVVERDDGGRALVAGD